MESSLFVIGKLLGEGDFAKVFLYKKKETKEKYAIKILKQSDEELKSYECETNTLSKVNHENIIKWVNSEKNGENLCIITEYFPGKTLFSVIELLRRPFTRSEIFQIFKPLMSALSYLHGLNIVHGDVALVNIMVKFGKSKNVEEVKLIDFGKSDPSFVDHVTLFNLTGSNDIRQVDVYLSGKVLLKMVFGTCSGDFILRIEASRDRPEVLNMMLQDVNPFFRNLVNCMMFDIDQRLESIDVLRLLEINLSINI